MTRKSKSPASAALALATKAARRLSLYATLTSHRMLGVFGHRDYVRFLVLTRSRTGSNLLLSFLNSHPNIFCEGETFAKMNGADPYKRLRRIYGKQPRHVHAKGFKIFYYHPLDTDAVDFWAELERHSEIRIIHLTRDNILRTLVSRKIAGTRGAWTGTRYDAGEAENKCVSMDAAELVEGFQMTRNWEHSATSRFGSHPLLQLSYEELVRRPEECIANLCQFLEVSAARPHTNLSQQNPESLRALVRNYDELKTHFAGTQWSAFFDD